MAEEKTSLSDSSLGGFLSDLKKLDSEREGLYKESAKREAEAAGKQSSAIKKGIARRREIFSRMPETVPPPVDELQEAPPAPNQPLGDPMSVFKTFAPALAILASFKSRKPLVSSMNALSSAMEGYRQGDKDKYERNRQIWKDNAESALKHNQLATQRYSLLTEKYKDDVARLDAEMRVAALDMQDEKMIGALSNKGGLEQALQLNKDRMNLIEKLLPSVIKSSGTSLSPDMAEAVNFYARQQVLNPDPSLYMNLGRSAGGAELVKAIKLAVPKVASELGISPEDLSNRQFETKGKQRALTEVGRIIGRVEVAKNTAEGAIGIVEEKLNNVYLTDFPTVNMAINAYNSQTGDPDIIAYGAAINTLVNEYGRVVAAGNGTSALADREHARDILSAAHSPPQMKAALATLRQEINNASDRAYASPSKLVERWGKVDSDVGKEGDNEDLTDEEKRELETLKKKYGR